MTSNIWGDYFGNPVSAREADIYKVYEKYTPDIIGFQEITKTWHKSDMFKKLKECYYFVAEEPGGGDVNFVPLAVKKGNKLLAKGYELLFDTGNDMTKAITWAVLKDEQKRVFSVANTHFTYMTGKREYDLMRENNASQLCSLMKWISERFDCPVFATGDMNCNRLSSVFTSVYKNFNVAHLFDMANEKNDVCSLHGDPVADSAGKYHGVKSPLKQDSSIDHIVALGRGFKVLNYRTVCEQYALDATDHSPVYADIDLH